MQQDYIAPQQFYDTYISKSSADIVRLRRRARFFVAAEIAAFATAIGLVAAYATGALPWGTLVAAAAMLAAYAAVRNADAACDRRIENLEARREVCMRERAALKGAFQHFDDGSRYADARHPYTTDLDVYGPQSLYQRVCRAVTTGGADMLAHTFAAPDAAHADEQADAIAALRDKRMWRTMFCALGVHGKTDTGAVKSALDDLAAAATPSWVLSPLTAAAAACAIAVLAAATVLAATGHLPWSAPGLWGIVMLGGTLGLCHGRLGVAARRLACMGDDTRSFVAIARQVARLDTGDALATRLQGTVCDALPALHELASIIKALDRRGNILALTIFDTCMMSDLWLLRRWARWQRRHTHDTGAWIEAVCRLDTLVSMSTWAYNNPHTTRATIDTGAGQGVTFKAKDMRHPFLGDKAVGNDFDIANRHYYIVTGANMAGKSTFLRAVGTNWLLAMCGMPVAAESLRLSPFNLFTSMRTTDDVTRGISYFNAELLRLDQLLQYCRRHPATLVILDEILKGTNSADKLQGSRMFLQHVARLDITGIVATHDLQLSAMAQEEPGRFHNWCFEIELGTEVTYSYKIAPGVATNQNASYLLRQLLAHEGGGK